MEFAILPGPPAAELARTAMARAVAASVGCDWLPARVAATVAVRTTDAGLPVLYPATDTPLARFLAVGPVPVTLTVPAGAPFAALRMTGFAGRDRVEGSGGYPMALRSVELTGASPASVPLAAYSTAAPDPLWQQAPAVLRHLERCHMAELVACVRAHGLVDAQCVIPRGLDRFGLELAVLSADGLGLVRLSFPDGPVAALDEVPASVRTVLTCRCAGRSHRLG